MTSKYDGYCECRNCGWKGRGEEAGTSDNGEYICCPYCGSGWAANMSVADLLRNYIHEPGMVTFW